MNEKTIRQTKSIWRISEDKSWRVLAGD